MKILEAQSAVLSNYEVYTHLSQQKQRYKHGFPGPANLNTLVEELLTYFITAPSPLAQDPKGYNETTIRSLLVALCPFALTKPETIMILNLRPTKPDILNTMIEELETRFTEEQQWEICNAIVRVLGKPDGEAERKAMTQNAEMARKLDEAEEATGEAEKMAIDQ